MIYLYDWFYFCIAVAPTFSETGLRHGRFSAKSGRFLDVECIEAGEIFLSITYLTVMRLESITLNRSLLTSKT